MTQFFEDFRGKTLDSTPPEFSVAWEGPLSLLVKAGNPLAGSANHLQVIPTSTGSFRRTAVKWDVGTTSGKTTVRFLAQFSPANVTIPGAFLSGSGATAQRTGYVQWWGSNHRLSKYDNGGDSAIASGSTPLSSSGTPTYYFEIIRDGALVEVRAWDVGGTRPATADASVTDATPLPVAGFFGISYLTNSSPTMEVYEIAVGTNGDTAPTAPVSTGPATPVNLGATNILTTSARLTWEQG